MNTESPKTLRKEDVIAAMDTVVITVTYNSSMLLKKTLDALLEQTSPADKIIVVDNASNDENKCRLREYARMSEKIEILWLDRNGGGAGGFYAGMRHAKEQYDPKWYWLMDDDAFPAEDCLEILKSYIPQLDNIGFLAPIIWGIDNQKHQLYHPRRAQKGPVCRFKPFTENVDALSEVETIDTDAFVGPLFSAEAVRQCGFPRPELFIEGDDTDYTFRVTRLFKGYLLRRAQMNHRDVLQNGQVNPRGWWKDYYWYRNTLLFQIHNIHGYKRLAGILYVLLWAIKSGINMIRDTRYDGYRWFKWSIIKKGIMDGLRQNEGAVLLPNDYLEQLMLVEAKNNK